MNITALIERFEYYAINLKDIKHDPEDSRNKAFFHVDIDSIQQAVLSGIKFPALFLQTPEVEKGGAYDNMSESFDFTYVILFKGTPSTKAAIFDQAKLLSDKVFNRLMLDVATGFLPGILSGTQEGQFGPMTDSIYGWGKSMAISDAYDAEAKQTDWEDVI